MLFRLSFSNNFYYDITSVNLEKAEISRYEIEDITWPLGNTKFLFECWRIFHSFAFFQHEKRNFQAAMERSIYYIKTNEIPNHFTLIVVRCERRDLLCSHSKGDIFTCEDNMLFSHVKISSFRAKAHLVFHWCLYNKKQYQLSPLQ